MAVRGENGWIGRRVESKGKIAGLDRTKLEI